MPDYHVEVEGHWYSTPFHLIHELVDVRIAGRTVEICHKGQRIAEALNAVLEQGDLPDITAFRDRFMPEPGNQGQFRPCILRYHTPLSPKNGAAIIRGSANAIATMVSS